MLPIQQENEGMREEDFTCRQKVLERCWHADINVLFIESICNDPVLLKKNYEMKLSNSGYIEL